MKLLRRYPSLYVLLLLLLALLATPLMISANNTTAVLYKDF